MSQDEYNAAYEAGFRAGLERAIKKADQHAGCDRKLGLSNYERGARAVASSLRSILSKEGKRVS
jgi:hypothetical protein